MMQIIDDIKLFNFTLSPGMGMLKEVERFVLGKDSSPEGNRYFLVSKDISNNPSALKELNEETGIPVYPMERPFKDSEKIPFMFRSLFLPILLSLVVYLFGLKNIFYASTTGMIFLSIAFLSSFVYVIMTVKQLMRFKNGVSDAVKNDYKVTMFFVILFFAILPFIFLTDSISYGEATSLFLNSFAIIVFIELVKKPALIILSDRVKFWYYHSITGGKEFWLVSSIRRGLAI